MDDRIEQPIDILCSVNVIFQLEETNSDQFFQIC